MPSLVHSFLLAAAALRPALGMPQAATQPAVDEDCDGFYAAKAGQQCSEIASVNKISMDDLLDFNPHISSTCDGLPNDLNVCISVINACEPQPPTPTSNGIATPTPDQPGIVGNCNAFYYVKPGDGCGAIAEANGITIDQFLQWNPAAGSQCQDLWANAYACVGVIGQATTPTQPGNGVTTPAPIQAGMVSNCKTFALVQSGQTCADIAAQYQISVSDFIQWNPAVGANCLGLWANTYACIAVLN